MTGPGHHIPEPAVSTASGGEDREEPRADPAPTSASEDLFAAKIAPMLAERCQPCHFPGGVMYDRLPFDQPETIRSLGDKLFSRIRDEQERQWIRDFLADSEP
ncbi:MAG: hypothetical protein ACRD2Z_18230 [Thermoanaerobaculia bacterium]